LAQKADTTQAKTEYQNQDYISEDIIIKDNAIQPIQVPNVIQPTTRNIGSSVPAGRHSTRAEKQVSVEELRLWLSDRKSPLADYSSEILSSPYWSTIIGICTIEQYGCSRAPGNNFWGIGPHKRFATIPDGIEAIDALLTKYEAKGKDTIEELNGYYVQPASQNWFNVVLKTKLTLESLN
jgi:hypothetical protein